MTTLQLFDVKRLIHMPSVLCAANINKKEAAESEGII